MEELIFFAVIILFSILESVARSRKKKAGGGTPQIPGEWEPEADEDEEAWRSDSGSEPARRDMRGSEVPTYDAERSRSEEAGAAEISTERTLPGYTRPYGTTAGTERSGTSGSEGMIPADIWEEIAGLAERPEARKRKTPPPTGPERQPARPRVESKRPPLRPARTQAPAARTHRVHLAHADYGTDPSSRPRSEQDGLDPLARGLSADAAAVRRQLRDGGRHALRRAVILQEVLGPPASMRRDGPLD